MILVFTVIIAVIIIITTIKAIVADGVIIIIFANVANEPSEEFMGKEMEA